MAERRRSGVFWLLPLLLLLLLVLVGTAAFRGYGEDAEVTAASGPGVGKKPWFPEPAFERPDATVLPEPPYQGTSQGDNPPPPPPEGKPRQKEDAPDRDGGSPAPDDPEPAPTPTPTPTGPPPPDPGGPGIPGPPPSDPTFQPPPPPPTCAEEPGSGDPYPTHGYGDFVFADLAWGTLKNGTRLIITWTTPEAEVGVLFTKTQDSNVWVGIAEGKETKNHVFILNDLAPNEQFCFKAYSQDWNQQSTVHKVMTQNGPTYASPSYPGYTVNLLVTANEQPAKGQIEKALADLSPRVEDMTDGHLRIGNLFLLYNHGVPLRHGVTCVGAGTPVGCDRLYDITFSHQQYPTAAGSATTMGIMDYTQAITINQLYNAPGTTLPLAATPAQMTGTLAHMFGIYGMGLSPKLGTSGLPPGCLDTFYDLSVMGHDRLRSEIDDEFARCPNEMDIPGYIPSWTEFMNVYIGVPPRMGPDPGPAGNSGQFNIIVHDIPVEELPNAPN